MEDPEPAGCISGVTEYEYSVTTKGYSKSVIIK